MWEKPILRSRSRLDTNEGKESAPQGKRRGNQKPPPLSLPSHACALQKRIYEGAAKWETRQLPGLAVKVQPFTRDLIIPASVGLEALSELDCFHPSYQANAAWAIA